MSKFEITEGSINATTANGSTSWVVEAYPRDVEIVDKFIKAWEELGAISGLDIAEIEERFGLKVDSYGNWEQDDDVDPAESGGEGVATELWSANTYNDGNLDVSNKLLKGTLLEWSPEYDDDEDEYGEERPPVLVLTVSHNFSDPRGSYDYLTAYEVTPSRGVASEDDLMWYWIEELEPRYTAYLRFVDGSTLHTHAENQSDVFNFDKHDATAKGRMAKRFLDENENDLDYAIDRLLMYGVLE